MCKFCVCQRREDTCMVVVCYLFLPGRGMVKTHIDYFAPPKRKAKGHSCRKPRLSQKVIRILEKNKMKVVKTRLWNNLENVKFSLSLWFAFCILQGVENFHKIACAQTPKTILSLFPVQNSNLNPDYLLRTLNYFILLENITQEALHYFRTFPRRCGQFHWGYANEWNFWDYHFKFGIKFYILSEFHPLTLHIPYEAEL